MLSTEPAAEVPISMVTTSHPQEDDKPYHVVLKPTPQRLHGSARGHPDGRLRLVANLSDMGAGAFTAYVPKNRQHGATSPHHTPSAAVSPAGDWTPVDDAGACDLGRLASPPDSEYVCLRERHAYYSPQHSPRSHYLSQVIKHESRRSSDENSDYSDQENHPIDLRNNSKKLESAGLDDASSNSPKHDFAVTTRKQDKEEFPTQIRVVNQHDEKTREQRMMLTDIKNESFYDDVPPGVGAAPYHRHQTVIMRNSFYHDDPSKSPEGAEYVRYTFRNNTARAEVFEIKSSYAPVNDDVLSHFADGSLRRDGKASPPDGQSCSYDSDEEIDVVSDDYEKSGGQHTDEKEQYMGDHSGEESSSFVGNLPEEGSCSGRSARDADVDSDSCEAQALVCKVAVDGRRTSSPEAGLGSARLTSPSSSDTRSLETGFSPGQGYGADPQDLEASWEVFSVEDLLLRNRVLVILWSLLGDGRLLEVGYPHAPVHRVLWLTVDVCCSVAGMKSAAAVPLSSDHDCRDDMLCFRDHTHRFLEVCAPTRDMWKQFGWAGLTVDAVVRKIYEEELRPRLSKLPADKLPPVIQRALVRLDRLEEIFELPGGGDMKVALPPFGSAAAAAAAASKLPSVADRSARADAHQPTAAKKKRGRPAKANQKTDPGRIERVMLWRFLLNLLEDPRNKPCIHWVQRDEGIFRILNTDWLARLWGRRHGNPRMTYEKMARAMRTYYRSKVLQPVPRTRNLPRKLIYKFNPAVIHKVSSTKYAPFSDRGLNYNTSAPS